MARPTDRRSSEQAQNDPDETNDPTFSDRSSFDTHIFTLLSQIFERLGRIDQKIENLAGEQGKVKDSVEKHDKLLTRAAFMVAGAIFVVTAAWFVYDNFLKGHIAFK